MSEVGPIASRVAAVAAVAVATMLFALVLTRDGDTYEVNAVFDDVRGLIEGGEVKAGAVNVGTVENITIGEDGLPVVTMSVDGDFVLRQGAFADLRVGSNVGAINRYVDLRQGDGEEDLSDGATLGPSQTDQPVDLDLAVSALNPKTREDLGEILSGLDRATKGRGPDVDRALRHSSKALAETANVLALVAADEEALQALVSSTSSVFGALAQSPADLGAAAEQIAATLDVAAARQLELRRTAAAFGPGLGVARAAVERLNEAAPNIRALLVKPRPVVDELVPTGRLLRPALDALKVVLAQASTLVREAPAQLRALKPVLDAAPAVVRRLEPIADGLNPFLDHLRARIPEVLNFFVLAGDATSNYDANGNMIRATAIDIQFPRHPNIIGPADNGPGSVQRPFDRVPGTAEGEPWTDYVDSMIGGGRDPRDFITPGEESP
ncbi:MAG: MlaD family protein [Solirubrobacterales bacterium]